MGFFDFLKNKGKQTDPLKDLTLSKLQTGYYVDYDLKTWKVTASHYYDWGDGDRTYEWQLISADDTLYLEREPDDEDYWSVSRKIPIGALGGDLKHHIIAHGDPPDQIEYSGRTFYLEETAGGHFYTNDAQSRSQDGAELLRWDFSDDSGKMFVSIEQWGETEFEAAAGSAVEEYQFTNILPTETPE